MTSKEADGWLHLLLPVVVGLLIAGTGGWTGERWGWGLTVMGLGPAMKLKYNEGYWTPNPALGSVREKLNGADVTDPRTPAQVNVQPEAKKEENGGA